jgi:hypothetical protein
LRRILTAAGASITRELNVSERMRQLLAFGMSPCVILFASARERQFQIVVTDCGNVSEIHILRVLLAA